MKPSMNRVKEIFDAVVDLEPGKEREEYLDEACARNAELRSKVEEFLAAFGEAGDFLESPPVIGAIPTAEFQLTEEVGQQIGRYKLLQKIGEGGFGIVFMAEQREPVRRKVALKIIKPGMDSKQIAARFDAERQALAIMDHTNIARVFDAGATESGRPYFVVPEKADAGRRGAGGAGDGGDGCDSGGDRRRFQGTAGVEGRFGGL